MYTDSIHPILLLCAYKIFFTYFILICTSLTYFNVCPCIYKKQAYNIWGYRVTPCLTVDYYTQLLRSNTIVKLEDAIFRNEKAFKSGNLNDTNISGKQQFLKIILSKIGYLVGFQVLLLKNF